MKFSEIKEGLGDIPGNVIDKLQAKTGMAGPADVSGPKKDKTDKDSKQKDDKLPPLRKLKTGTKFRDNNKRIWVYSSEKQMWYDVDDNQQTLDANSGYKLLQRAKQKAVVTESVLKESNNIFKKDPKDRETRLTSRIPTSAVRPTVDFIEKITGLEFVDEDLLGSTGKKSHPDGTFEKNSSGDLDLNTDLNKITKEELIAKLVAWCKKQGIPDLEIMNKGNKFTAGWIKDAGNQVHFRVPIQGGEGYVQADFMLTTKPDYQRGAKRGGTARYTGKDRAIFLSSIARGRGYKFSPTNGVVDPNNGDAVIADDWNEIAKILLGPNAKESDTHTVESMLEIIIKLPEYEDLVAQARESGMDLPNKGEL